MKKLWEFIKDAGTWGVSSATTALVLYLMTLLGVSRTYAPWINVITVTFITVPLFWLGAVIAWNKKAKALEVYDQQSPRIYAEAFVDFGPYTTPFRLANRGASIAHNVHIIIKGLKNVYFHTVDHLPAGETVEVLPNVVEGGPVAGILHGMPISNSILPELSRDSTRLGAYTQLYRVTITCTNYKQNIHFKTSATLHYYPQKEAHHAQHALSSNNHRHTDILEITHTSFSSSPIFYEKYKPASRRK
jgi:hypothetical protein